MLALHHTYQTQVRSYYSSIFLNWTDSRLLQDWATSLPFIEPESNHCLPLPQTFVDLNYLTWIEVTNSRSKGNLFQRLQVHWKSFPLPFNFMSVLFKLPFLFFWLALSWYLWQLCSFPLFFGRFCSFSYIFGWPIPFQIILAGLAIFDILGAGIILFWFPAGIVSS